MADEQGTPPAAPPAPAAAPPAVDVAALQARIAVMEQQNNALMTERQQMAAYAQQLAAQQQKPVVDDEPVYVDPSVVKHVSSREKALLEKIEALSNHVAQQSDQLDVVNYRTYAGEKGVQENVAKEAERIYLNARSNGTNINGKPMSRVEALYLAAGKLSLDGSAETKSAKEKAEAERRAANEHAFVERGSGRPRELAGKDPDKMTRKERLSTYWSAALDGDEGF